MRAAKLFSAVMILVLIAPGCKKNETTAAKDEFVIVTSFYPVYITALNVASGIEGVRVLNLTPSVTGCLHDYTVTSSDMQNLEDADILLINGAGMESFMGKISGKYPGLKTDDLLKGITLIKNGAAENPHVWVSVSNAASMADNCMKILCAADPGHAEKYISNGSKYIKDLKELKAEMSAALEKYKGRKIITFHEAFPYFAEEYKLEIAAVIEREPGSEPSARELAETINLVRNAEIKIIFTEPQYPASSADVIARETGAKIFNLDPAVTGDDDKGAYIKIMKKNLSVLVRALSEK